MCCITLTDTLIWDLQSVENIIRDDRCIVNLKNIGEKLQASSSDDISQQINESVNSAVKDWVDLCSRAQQIQTRFSKAKRLWENILENKQSVNNWLKTVLPYFERENFSQEIISKVVKELPDKEQNMTELTGLAGDLLITLCHPGTGGTSPADVVVTPAISSARVSSQEQKSNDSKFPLICELENLQRKIFTLKNCLDAAIQYLSSKNQTLGEVQAIFSSVSKVF